MKILFVANKDITLYLFRKELIEKVIEEKHQVTILCPYGEKLEYFKEIGCNIIDYQIDRRGTNPIKELLILIKFNRVVRKLKPDYIFTYTIKPNLYMGLVSRLHRKKNIPTITGLGSSIYNKGLLSFLLKKGYKFSLKKSHKIVFQNNENQTWFEENISSKVDTMLVQGSGVNLQKYKYTKQQKNDTTTFLFIGRIMKEKGINELLDASIKLKEKYNDKVNIILCGYFEEDYEKVIKDLDNRNIIKYIGYIDDTTKVIMESDVLVLPSYHEGLSNVLLEAQASGRPVIASNISGCKETFVDNKTGYLIKPKDADDLFSKMEIFHLENYEKKIEMGYLAREYVVNNFDRNIVINNYINIIK